MPAPSPNAAKIEVPPVRPWVILLVDDEPDILSSLKDVLEASIPNLRVITAPSGRIGLELLERERVDLIISDFKMPGMDGIEFLYQARRLHGAIPRVMLTAFGNEDLARRSVVEAFATGFLSKASPPGNLIADVTRLLRYQPSSQVPDEAN